LDSLEQGKHLERIEINNSILELMKIAQYKYSKGLSVMSGLASNPANREIASSSGVSEYQDIFFSIFFQFCFSCIFSKNLKKYDLTRPKVSKYSLTS
jgi:hypothetical protein